MTAALTFTTRGVAAPERRRALHALLEKGLLPIFLHMFSTFHQYLKAACVGLSPLVPNG